MYDFAHGQTDAIEGITHSICTLEFEDHRPLYEWFLDNLPVPSRPRQYEFARLNLTYTMMSKRKLQELVSAACQRMGRSAHADACGLAPARLHAGGGACVRRADRRGKANSVVDIGVFEFSRPRRSSTDGAARDGGAASAQGRHRELSAGSVRGARSAQSSRRSHGWEAARSIWSRALHRARRLHGESAEEVLSLGSRPRGSAALCLFHYLPGGGEGRRRAGG